MSTKRKVVIDASNIKVGGGLQVSLSLIHYLMNNEIDDLIFFYIVSEKVLEQIENKEHEQIYLVSTGIKTLNPCSSSSISIRRTLGDIQPDLIFTVFGPSFYNWPSCKRLIGFANAWIVEKNTIAYQKLNLFDRCLTKVKNFILRALLYRDNAHYVTETNHIRDRFLHVYKKEPDIISVVPNAIPYMYDSHLKLDPHIIPDFNDTFKFITISADYPHKNISIIEDVGDILDKRGLKFIFLVTLPKDSYEKKSNSFKKYTYNLGPIKVSDCPMYYSYADAMFLPTLLECFSVSYLEAMACNTPILTSDFSFAREVCDDAALYFDPLSASSIADQLEQIILHEDISEGLILRAQKVLLKHISNEERTKMYVELITKVGV